MPNKISTDTLFHYTSLEACKSILACGGFRYSKQVETVPYPKFPYTQTNYVVCFCDLPSSDAPHLRKARPVAIGLTKEWGIKNRISPVRYVHTDSVGVGGSYLAFKNLNHLPDVLPEPYSSDRSYLQMLQASRLRELSEQYGDGTPMDPTALRTEHGKLEKYMRELVAIADGNLPEDEAMRQTFSALMWAIRRLHNELEDRDSYMRCYEENLPTGERIRNYDEREWRALSPHGFKGDETIDAGSDDKWLKPEFNLTFNDEDVLEIVVPDQSGFNALQSFLKSFGRTELSNKIQIVPIIE